jgi:cytoskeletal protein RodZ
MKNTKSRTILTLLVTGILILVMLMAVGSSCNRKTTTSTTTKTSTSTTTKTTTYTTTGTTTTTSTSTATTTTTPTTTKTTTTTPITTATTTTTTTVVPSGLAPTTQNTFDLEVRNTDFSVHNLIVSAGARVTITFHNEDSGIAHNLAIYSNQGATNTFFQGTAITGPAAITYKFTAPTTPGAYFFRSDTYPAAMTGNFIVQ